MKKSVAAGFSYLFIFLLLLSSANGFSQVLDSSFGTNGLYKSFTTTEEKYVRAIGQQSDGKMLIINSFLGSSTANIIRLTKTGSTDSTFGVNGVINIQYTNATVAYGTPDIKVASNDAFYSAVRVYVTDSGYTSIVNAYDKNGIPNSQFGNNGHVQVQLDSDPKLAIDSAGKIYACSGNIYCRLLPTGALDSTYGINGYSNLIIGNAFIIKLLPGGKLLSYGYLGNNGFSLIRLRHNGTVDSSFGVNGFESEHIVNTGQGVLEVPVDFIVKMDGSIVCECLEYTSTKNNEIIYHLTPNGQLDLSFGTNGNVVSASFEYPKCINEVENKKILTTCMYKTMGVNYLTFTKYNANGTLDLTYGSGGYLKYSMTALGIQYLNISSHYTGKNRKIYLAGDNYVSGSYSLALTSFIYNAPAAAGSSFITTTSNKVSINNVDKVLLYPNPVAGYLFVQGLKPGTEARLTITDANGRRLATASTSQSLYKWNLQHLTSGVYYLTIIQNNTTNTLKFIKQ